MRAPDAETIARAVAAVRDAKKVICLSGAGISVPSGIPDFRSPGGLWTRMDPMEYATSEAFRRDPAKVWALFREIHRMSGEARPNPAHEALVSLETAGLLDRVITQNIDGLHQAAGSRGVIELHGGGKRVYCVDCQVEVTLDPEAVNVGVVPRCSCGGVLKLDVILFGEPLPDAAIRDAVTAAEEADVILVTGTSATVAPASSLPLLVQARGGTIIEMNLERTVLSDRAAIRLEGDLTVTLTALVEAALA